MTTLSFQGHVMSLVTWPIDVPYTISYWQSIGNEALSLTVFEIFASKYIWITTLTFQGPVTSQSHAQSIHHMPFPVDVPLELSLYLQPFSSYLVSQTSPHTQKHTQTYAASDFIVCPMECVALHRQFICLKSKLTVIKIINAIKIFTHTHKFCDAGVPIH